jgi:hypothetical protein
LTCRDGDVVYRGDEGVVMENRNALPKAWFADSLAVAPRARDAIEELNRFDASHTAILMDADRIPEIIPTHNRAAEVTRLRTA